MIRRLKGEMARKINCVKWLMQKQKIGIELDGCKNINSEISQGDKILIISPHPDDELISCFNTILRFGGQCTIAYTGLTGYEYNEKAIRTKEFKAFCDVVGVESILLGKEWESSVFKILKNRKFDVVFIPTFIDWHWEHRDVCAVMTQVLNECNYSGKLFWYQVTVPIPTAQITHYNIYNRIGEKNKWQTFKEIYKSQSFMPLYRMRQTDNRYILKNKRYYAEVFWKMTISDSQNLIEAIGKKTDLLDSGKSKINDLLQILGFVDCVLEE